MSEGLSLEQLVERVNLLLEEAPQGQELPELTISLIQYAIRISSFVLDTESAREFAEYSIELGATPEELHEILALVAGIGVHSFMVGSKQIEELAERHNYELPVGPEEAQQQLVELTGNASYWITFESYVPGFLHAIARVSPSALEGFMTIGALPMQTRTLAPLTRELISIAIDSMPTHRYMPGLELHLHNALKLGAGATQVLAAMKLGVSAPPHCGVPSQREVEGAEARR